MKRDFTQDEVVSMLKKEMETSESSLTQFAKSKGVSKQYLYNVLTKKQLPGIRIGFQKIRIPLVERFLFTRTTKERR